MTSQSPLERIAELLVSSGYRQLAVPFRVAGVPVDVAAAFIGNPPLSDVVIVADTAREAGERTLRRVEGVARALDVLQSRRPLTAVLLGPSPRPAVLQAMTRVCRVLPIDSTEGGNLDPLVQNWLAVLMPLRLPAPGNRLADPLSEVSRAMAPNSPLLQEFLDAAADGTPAVRAKLYALINEVVEVEGAEGHP